MSAFELPTTLPPSWQEVRLLPKPERIRQRVDEILGAVPLDKTYAVVAVADLIGFRLAAMVRLYDGWSFSGYLRKDWFGGRLDGGAELRYMN